jgi:DNA-binding beta-propeller fold protein YncE
MSTRISSALLFCVLLIVAGVHEAVAQGELFVTNDGGNSITVFPRNATGDPPSRIIAGAATGLSRPKGIAVDPVNNEIFVANLQANSITVYGLGANGNVAPLRTISGAATNLNSPYGVVVDPVNNEVYVVNGTVSGNVTVYPRTANGNVAPSRTFFGFNAPADIALDLANNEIAVANSNGNTISVFARTGGGVLRTIGGPATGISAPLGVAIDSVNNEIVVANHIGITATVYPRTANGNVAPIRSISLGFQPNGVAVDTANNEILLVSLNNAVIAYDRTATGSAPIKRSLFSSSFASTIDAAFTAGAVVGPGGTSTVVVSSVNPSTVGQSITFTATVTGANPTGTVQFADGGASLGGAVVLTGGTASLTTAALAQGAHSITAAYGGDSANSASTSPAVVQVVNAVIVPPVGPASAAPIPTLSQWVMILLALILAVAGAVRIARRDA